MIKQVRIETLPLYETKFSKAERQIDGYDIPDKINMQTCLTCDRICKRGWCEKIKTRYQTKKADNAK